VSTRRAYHIERDADGLPVRMVWLGDSPAGGSPVSDKPFDKLNPLDVLVRRTARCGMTVGTVMTIEFISGFELFNTRPYHNYDTWSQGWRVHGLGVIVEREDLDEAVQTWAQFVTDKRAGASVAAAHDATKHQRDGQPYRAGVPLEDWIRPGEPSWMDGVKSAAASRPAGSAE